MRVLIEATDLPGRTCGPDRNFPGYGNIHVGVQRRDRPDGLLDLQPGDAKSAAWALDCTAAAGDITGRHIQGRPGSRFIYLCWGTVDDTGGFSMFRRAKLMFDGIGPDVLEAAAARGRLVARLGLTDSCGQPLCAAVRPPWIHWSAG